MDIIPGQFTATIYGAIRDEKYIEAIDILQMELQDFPRNRAALSLLGYCYYKLGAFPDASQCYEQLVMNYPEVEEYKVYYAQTLYKAGLYPEATKASIRVDSEQYSQRMLLLQSMIKYETDELPASKALLDQCQDDPEVVINYAAIAFKEGKFEAARKQYTEALTSLGYQPDVTYNIALCYYFEKQYGQALRHISEIIEKGIRHHPELSVGSNSDGIEARSVGNSAVLKETCLIEAFNLKAAIEYQLRQIEPAKATKDTDSAREALADMPPRHESELDPVSLHNQALMNAEQDPTGAFRKLSYLLPILLIHLKHLGIYYYYIVNIKVMMSQQAY